MIKFTKLLNFKNPGERMFVNGDYAYVTFLDPELPLGKNKTKVTKIAKGKVHKTLSQATPFEYMFFDDNQILATDFYNSSLLDEDLNLIKKLDYLSFGRNRDISFGINKVANNWCFGADNIKDGINLWTKGQLYCTRSVCVGKNYLYLRIGGTKLDNLPPTIQALEFETGEVVWELKFSREEYSASSTKIIGVAKEHVYIYGNVTRDLFKVSVATGKSVEKYKVLYTPILYKNKLIAFGATPNYDLWQLNLDTNEVSTLKLEQEIAPYGTTKSSVMPLNCIADGLAFGGIYQEIQTGFDKDNFKVVALDLETNKIVVALDLPYKGFMQTFRQAEYANNRFYFLDGDNSLTIFEKEREYPINCVNG